MEIRYVIVENDAVTNITDIDDSIIEWFLPLLHQIFPTWEVIPLADCVKADDGNPADIWIGWARNAEGKFYDPNWVPPAP